MPSTHRYILDASVMIDFSVESYYADIFKSFWIKLSQLVDEDRIKVIDIVWEEVQGASKVPFESLESKCCVSLSQLSSSEEAEIQNLVAEMLRDDPGILRISKGEFKS